MGSRRRRSSSGSAAAGCSTGALVVVLGAGLLAWDWIVKNPVPTAIAIAVLAILAIVWLKGRTPVPQVRVATLEGFLALTPSGFEHETAALFSTLGFTGMTVSGGAGDLSVDVFGTDPSGRPTFIQCKRYAPDRRIGSPEIQQLYGMAKLRAENARIIFVTTSGYTAAALDIARRAGVETDRKSTRLNSSHT